MKIIKRSVPQQINPTVAAETPPLLRLVKPAGVSAETASIIDAVNRRDLSAISPKFNLPLNNRTTVRYKDAALIASAEAGDLDLMHKVMKEFPNVNAAGGAAIATASAQGHLHIVQELVRNGARIDGEHGALALAAADASKHEHVAAFLRQHGAGDKKTAVQLPEAKSSLAASAGVIEGLLSGDHRAVTKGSADFTEALIDGILSRCAKTKTPEASVVLPTPEASVDVANQEVSMRLSGAGMPEDWAKTRDSNPMVEASLDPDIVGAEFEVQQPALPAPEAELSI